MNQLILLQAKPLRRVIGLMSGTSLDGLDIALCQMEGQGGAVKIHLQAFWTYPMPDPLKKRIQSACGGAFGGSAEALCRLNFDLGDYFAQGVLEFMEKEGLDLKDIDLIGSHGQTIWHCNGHSSLQIGESAVIAQKTGIPVVDDFRVADIAVGGTGAPLVPYLDQILYADPKQNIALHNLGGISNFTYLSKDEEPLALDTGPCNAPLNELCEVMTGGKQSYDQDGALARTGQVIPELVELWLQHPYFALDLPKSTGREEFGVNYVKGIIAAHPEQKPQDLMRSMVRMVATSIAQAYRRFAPAVEMIYVSGGGMHHPVLMEDLQELLGGKVRPLPVSEALEPDAKEAVAFALLAHEWVNGTATNIPSVTGAKKKVSLGKLTLP